MGIVKISDELHTELRVTSKALSRSINAQAEHWLKVGQLVEANPEMSYFQACQVLVTQARETDNQTPDIKAEQDD